MSFFAISVTLFIAMVLEVIDLSKTFPLEIGFLRPEWVLMTLIYWMIALPQRVGVMMSWGVGILMDVLLGSGIGHHSLSFLLISYISLKFYQRLRMFSVVQQAIVVFGFLFLHVMISFSVEYFFYSVTWTMWNLMPLLTSALIWPLVFLLLRALRRSLQLA
ncbi:MAG: rod shape-determining protein MreD [Gammaproteobacteria bacterium]|nr:rod shape-determining protein MreD [Gammaproteobacteria bacterium]